MDTAGGWVRMRTTNPTPVVRELALKGQRSAAALWSTTTEPQIEPRLWPWLEARVRSRRRITTATSVASSSRPPSLSSSVTASPR